eukprot:960815-Alexandrium_andersonii.AAC.1
MDRAQGPPAPSGATCQSTSAARDIVASQEGSTRANLTAEATQVLRPAGPLLNTTSTAAPKRPTSTKLHGPCVPRSATQRRPIEACPGIAAIARALQAPGGTTAPN